MCFSDWVYIYLLVKTILINMFGITGAIIGIILIILGIFFVFFLTGTSHAKLPTYQPQEFSVTFIVMGIIFIIIGAILIFVG